MCEAPLDICDVLNKENLRKFLDKRSEWISWLNGGDQNSVWKQLTAMEWNHRIFLMINECTGIAAGQEISVAARNLLLAEFINQGYAANQSLGIRKQLEPGRKHEPDKQIISLRRTLDDIASNKHLINRECYVCYDGVPYDYEPIRQAYHDDMLSQIDEHSGPANELPFTSHGVPMNGPLAWSSSERRHKAFDRLSGKPPEDRSRCDLISPRIFGSLYKKIDKDAQHFHDVVEFTNKYVAHAADENSIRTLSDGQHGISIDKVETCQKALWQVTQYVSSTVLYDTYMVPGITYQGDPLKFLNQPWIADGDLAAIYDFWNAGEQSRDDWPKDFETELEREMANYSEAPKR